MKKLLAILVAVLCVAAPQEMTAQSLLKKIGKSVGNEIINELKSKKNEEKKSQSQETAQPQSQPQSQPKAQTQSKPAQQSSTTTAQQRSSTSNQPVRVAIDETCPNPNIISENARGANIVIEGIEYVIHTDKKEAYLMRVSKELQGKTSSVTVWGGIQYKGVVYPVTTIMAHAFEGESLTSVKLSHNLQEIREEAFCHSRLKRVVVHGATKRIGASAFADTPLESVTLGNGIERIETNAFANCRMLTSVQIPESVTSLGASVFQDCERLTQVIFPRNIKRIPSLFFDGCTALVSYSIPSTVETIGEGAFSRSGLKTVRIPLNVKTIEKNVFKSCPQLEQITIPSTVENFGDNIFLFCDKINSVYINVKFKDAELIRTIFGYNSHLLKSYNLDECPAFTWTE